MMEFETRRFYAAVAQRTTDAGILGCGVGFAGS